MLMWPLGLRPFFDVIWTTGDQPGNPYNYTRHNVELQAILAILTQGPLGIGDGLGLTNSTLVSMLCTGDGTLLHPSKPATPLDIMYSPGLRPPQGEIWQTHSEIAAFGDATVMFHLLVGIDLSVPQNVSREADLWSATGQAAQVTCSSPQQCLFFSWEGRSSCVEGPLESQCATPVGDTLRLETGPATAPLLSFNLWSVTPLLRPNASSTVAYALLGELDKVVPVSPQRVSHLDFEPRTGAFRVSITGAPGERVKVTAVRSSSWSDFTVLVEQTLLSLTGEATLSFL